MSANQCPISKDKRTQLKSVMNILHFDQSSEGRHKCAYCAYRRGYEQGYADAQKGIAGKIIALAPYNEHW